MGGCFQTEWFETVEQLVAFIEEQIKKANGVGLYLLEARIKQSVSSDGIFEWTAYFSK